MRKHRSWSSRLMTRIRAWWTRFRWALREYEKQNLAEWREGGARRAGRMLGSSRKPPARPESK